LDPIDRPAAPLRIAVSSCLLGERVRYDGGHKLEPYVSETLARHFVLVAVCPEVAIGMGVPRPPIRLVGSADHPRAIGVHDPAIDATDALSAYGHCMAETLRDVSGYVFKSRSPSCGLFDVPVFEGERIQASGRGLYAREITAHHPLMPAEEEQRLTDHARRESFVERVLAYRRWQDMIAVGVTAQRLLELHRAHKLALMAHDEVRYRALGRLAAESAQAPVAERAARYGAVFMETLEQAPTRKGHTNALMHALGFLKKRLGVDEKGALLEAIDAYRSGVQPWSTPAALLQHHFRAHPHPWIAEQTYLHPHPAEREARDAAV
jgi:uncharacterized protein YbgA (DUF1722 family)/uncharacterized protein YbbK (DUF523 family)